MSSELVKSGNGELTPEQIDLVKRTVAVNLSNDELALFLYQAKRSGLDPLAKQIHAIKRNSKDGGRMTIQTSIDGYRLIADRTGQYAGNDDPIYAVNDKTGFPVSATVTVYKIVHNLRCPFTATARWTEYFPGDAQGFMWKKMPFLMLGKCAEALALRKAFPAELSGIYTNEEMDQAQDTIIQEPVQEIEKPKIAAPAPKPAGDKPTAEEKINWLKRCEAAKVWLKEHGADDDVFRGVYGAEGLIQLDEANSLKLMHKISDEYKRIAQEILEVEKLQKAEPVAAEVV